MLSHLHAIPSLVLSIVFGGIAIFSSQGKNLDTEFFLTARNSVPAKKIAWSFYSSTIGAWTLFIPGAYAVDPITGAGWVGLICYALACGFPILIIAWLGSFVRSRHPKTLSIGDFVSWRYGRIMEVYTTLLVIFSVGLTLSIEYTTIGGLFEHFYGVHRSIPITLIFFITMIYTSVGGVYVSIITDQWQAMFSIFLSVISVIFVGLTFRPGVLPELPPYLAVNESGLGSIVTLGVSFFAHAIFNDAYWQRVWSSQDENSLKKGSFGAFFMIVIVVFLFGFYGFLASWAGYVSDPTYSFFEIIISSGGNHQDLIMVLVTLFAVAMNESLVDSYQNALTDCASSLALSCNYNVSISVARIITIIMNVPIVIIGLQGYDVNSIFLVACLATTTAFIPVMLGIFSFWDDFIKESTAIFSCIFSIFSVMVYGWIVTGSFLKGLYHCFWEAYRWQVFLVAVGSSLLGIFLFIICHKLYCHFTGTPWTGFSPSSQSDHNEEASVFIHSGVVKVESNIL